MVQTCIFKGFLVHAAWQDDGQVLVAGYDIYEDCGEDGQGNQQTGTLHVLQNAGGDGAQDTRGFYHTAEGHGAENQVNGPG